MSLYTLISKPLTLLLSPPVNPINPKWATKANESFKSYAKPGSKPTEKLFIFELLGPDDE